VGNLVKSGRIVEQLLNCHRQPSRIEVVLIVQCIEMVMFEIAAARLAGKC
jgi:hypothetical protein